MDDTSDRPDDIHALWEAAVDEYARTTGDNLFTPSHGGRTIDSVLAFATEKQGHFTKWRNNGGKVSKLRAALKKCLGPLNALGGFVATCASPVGNGQPDILLPSYRYNLSCIS